MFHPALRSAHEAVARFAPWRVYCENTTSRHAFYEVSSNGSVAHVRWGKIGSHGTTKRDVNPFDALTTLNRKLDADYVVVRSSARTDPATVAPARTLRDRLTSTTMRATTMTGWWQLVESRGLRLMPEQPDELDGLYRGALGARLWLCRDHKLWVVVRYEGENLTYGLVD